MIKFIRIFFLFFICLQAFGQNTSSIVVRDSITGEVLPFTNIGIKGTAKGTNSNLKGEFYIKCSDEDTLVISYMGYMTQVVPCNQIDSVVYLVPASLDLKEVLVTTNRNTNSYKVNIKNSNKTLVIKGGANQYAMLVENRERRVGFVYSVFFNTKPAIKSEGRWESLVRIRVYSNVNGVPGEDLLTESVQYRIKKRAGAIRVNLSDYNIPVPKDGCFIGIDLLGFFDEDDNYIPYSSKNIAIDTRMEFSQDKEGEYLTYSKFFGTNWGRTEFRNLQGEYKVVGAKFGVKIEYYED